MAIDSLSSQLQLLPETPELLGVPGDECFAVQVGVVVRVDDGLDGVALFQAVDGGFEDGDEDLEQLIVEVTLLPLGDCYFAEVLTKAHIKIQIKLIIYLFP